MLAYCTIYLHHTINCITSLLTNGIASFAACIIVKGTNMAITIPNPNEYSLPDQCDETLYRKAFHETSCNFFYMLLMAYLNI